MSLQRRLESIGSSVAVLYQKNQQWPIQLVLFRTAASWQVLLSVCSIHSFLIFLNLKEGVDKEIIRDTVLRVLPKRTGLYGPCSCRHYQACYCLVAQNGVFSPLEQFALACWWADICGNPWCPAKGLFLSWINKALQAQVQDQQRFMETFAVHLPARALYSPEIALSF